MTFRLAGIALAAVAVASAAACSLPLASRRAQVLEPGELEASVGAAGGVLFTEIAGGSFSSSYLPAFGSQASARFGLIPRIDLQLRLLDVLVPEVSAGWQLVGDPAANDFAVTLTGGVGPNFSVGFSNATGVFGALGLFIPVQLLVDVPVGDGALTFGARAIGAGSRLEVNGTSSYSFVLTPGVTAAWTVPLGHGFFIRPEIAASVPLFTGAPLGTSSLVVGAIAVCYEFRLD